MIATLLMVLLSPLFIIIPVLIKLDSRGPVIYKRRVIGLNKKRFYMLKFRTMNSKADEILSEWKDSSIDLYNNYNENLKLDNDPRITSLGKLLRKSSLDELPQLVNVLYGEMSLVGPRPLTDMIGLDERSRYTKKHLKVRFTVMPGISGMWQVCGRQNIPYSGREKLDQHYIDNLSMALDLRIILITPLIIIKGKGAL